MDYIFGLIIAIILIKKSKKIFGTSHDLFGDD